MIVLCRQQPPNPRPSSSPITPQTPTCRLLALPAEIRIAIWELLLIQSHISDCPPRPPAAAAAAPPSTTSSDPTITATATTITTIAPPPRFCANVLRTCRQIHAEGTPILYGANPFLAHPSLLASLPAFLLRIRPPPRAALAPVTAPHLARLVRRYLVHVRLDTDPRFTRADAEEAFAGCDALEIEVFQASYGTCDFAVLRLFEGVRGVGSVRIRGSIGDGRYVGWLARRMMGKVGEEGDRERWFGGEGEGRDVWTHGNR